MLVPRQFGCLAESIAELFDPVLLRPVTVLSVMYGTTCAGVYFPELGTKDDYNLCQATLMITEPSAVMTFWSCILLSIGVDDLLGVDIHCFADR